MCFGGLSVIGICAAQPTFCHRLQWFWSLLGACTPLPSFLTFMCYISTHALSEDTLVGFLGHVVYGGSLAGEVACDPCQFFFYFLSFSSFGHCVFLRVFFGW